MYIYNKGISPLLISSHRNHLKVVKELLKNGKTDINLQDHRGRTALMVSCAEDRKAVVKELLKNTEIEIFSISGHTNMY